MEDKQVAFYLMDASSGELVNEIYYNDKISITREKQQKYLNSTIALNNKKTFTKCFNLPLRELATLNLTSDEWNILVVMISNIGLGYYNGIVIKIQNNQFMGFMTSKDIQDVIRCSDSSFKRAIKDLQKKEIIKTQKKGRDNIFIINPFIFAKDKRIPKTLFKLFENTKYNYLGEHLPLQNSNK